MGGLNSGNIAAGFKWLRVPEAQQYVIYPKLLLLAGEILRREAADGK
ncbi:MAG: hypothetical protein M1438_11645 [Deltaproteobacteria bacterium]|nr:hypothetical protein [Deltaproteobacteria bacterium]